MRKNVYKRKIKEAVNKYALAKLKAECKTQKKTGMLDYVELTLFHISNCKKTAKAMDLKFCNIEFTHNTDLS